MALLTAKAPVLNPQLVLMEFANHFWNKLNVATFAAHLPIAGNMAAIQIGRTVKGDALPLTELWKAAAEMAESVNGMAANVGATHVSFEELDHSPQIDGCHQIMDKGTGIAVRMQWAIDAATQERLTRLDLCFRLWKLLPVSPEAKA